MNARHFIRLVVLLLILGLLGCKGQGGAGAGAAIFGLPIGGNVNFSALPFARVSLNGVNIFGVSDQSGAYRIPGVPTGAHTLRVSKWNTAIVTLPLVIDPVNMPIVDLGRINQVEGNTITLQWPQLGTGVNNIIGRVVDGDGNGVNEVEVLLTYANGAIARSVTQSDPLSNPPNGYFQLENLPDAPLRLIIGQDGFRPLVIEAPFGNLAKVGETFEVGEVTLSSLFAPGSNPAAPVVEVVDTEGNPLPGVPVHLSVVDPEFNPIDRFGIGGITGSDGRWAFAAVPGALSYQVWAGSGQYFPATKSVTLDPGEERIVTLTLSRATGGIHPYFTQTN